MKIQNSYGFSLYNSDEELKHRLNNNCTSLQLDDSYIKLNGSFLDFSAEDDKIIIVAAYEKKNLSEIKGERSYEVKVLGLNVINSEVGTLKLRNNRNYHIIILLKEVYDIIKKVKLTDEEVYKLISTKGIINIKSEYLIDKLAYSSGYISMSNMIIGYDGLVY